MKIDLHCHTKKVKSGDKETRNVTAQKFKEVMSSNLISICAITNHNNFDLQQYNEFNNECSGITSIWPGVEFDVDVNGEKGHMLIICNPDELQEFDTKINNIIGTTNVDDFCINYVELFNELKSLDVIIIAHYLLMKNEGFGDKSISLIKKQLNDKIPFLLEPSNLKCVGIMYAHDLDGFIGSDVQDWNKYPSNKIPSLKMPVKDFNTFKLLLKKDHQAINTFLNQKTKENVSIKPFSENEDYSNIDIPIYNDVNIIFGGKGTEKSKILEALKNYYVNKDLNSVSYYKASDNFELYKKMTEFEIDDSMFEKFEIDSLKDDFELIKNWTNEDVITTNLFFKGFRSKQAKGKISKFGFFKTQYSFVDNSKEFKDVRLDLESVNNMILNRKKVVIENYISTEETSSLDLLLKELHLSIFEKLKKIWIENESKKMLQKTIELMQQIGKIKSGEQAIPSTIGLTKFYSNLLKLYSPIKKISDSFLVKHKEKDTFLGYIPEKGDIYLKEEFYINPDEKIQYENIKLKYAKNKMKKTELSSFKKDLFKIKKCLFSDDCSSELANLNAKYLSKATSLIDCFAYRSYTFRNCKGKIEKCDPSDGEKSMLQIHNSLLNDSKKIFILDEPELSVGHNYINMVVVPRIKELAALDKTIIISTHDANIAVRTLPLNSIYREFKKTFVGNLFVDKLINIDDGSIVSWSSKSLDCLEGGMEAFVERGDSYGV